MITGTLKNKIDAIWQEFYNENMSQVSDVVDQLTALMFIKMLDDKQNSHEARAQKLNHKLNDDELIFKKGDYKKFETINGEEKLVFSIPYDELRRKNFKNLNSIDLGQRIKNYVFPFIKDETNKMFEKFALFAERMNYGFDDKERLLSSVVDKLSDPELDFSNNDIMGDVYEYICGSGISGQYRTPRHIIDLAVEMMKPKLGEKIIDPAMGTAGFIIESAKYIQNNQKEEKYNSKNNEIFNNFMFYGCDNDPRMTRIAYMNSILHGISNPNFTLNSLLEGENSKDYIGKFDLVLANPPFSGSIVKEAINGAVLALTKTSKTELLFVALMLMLLKLGGRCMTIVPDGVLQNTNDKAYISLRSELIDNQKLIGVISMPNGIFSASSKKGSSSKGAGVKTSFLIFEKTNNGGTDNVWFYNMTNDGYSLDVKRTPIGGSDIPDIINRFNNLAKEFDRERTEKSFMVPVEEIRMNDYILSYDAYKKVIKKPIVYRKTSEILTDIKKNYEESEKILLKLEKELKAE